MDGSEDKPDILAWAQKAILVKCDAVSLDKTVKDCSAKFQALLDRLGSYDMKTDSTEHDKMKKAIEMGGKTVLAGLTLFELAEEKVQGTQIPSCAAALTQHLRQIELHEKKVWTTKFDEDVKELIEKRTKLKQMKKAPNKSGFEKLFGDAKAEEK